MVEWVRRRGAACGMTMAVRQGELLQRCENNAAPFENKSASCGAPDSLNGTREPHGGLLGHVDYGCALRPIGDPNMMVFLEPVFPSIPATLACMAAGEGQCWPHGEAAHKRWNIKATGAQDHAPSTPALCERPIVSSSNGISCDR
ncbi:hypothetical protein OPT61_g10156 [Boeremia exigua]|uniref:Uncharacterized protein n=1 Tax=Boeremia exigua TaxID=749465 RepID=A0ACC2HR82_9PLEO|nr:hypothetical protein OPT61_g10156 [Boeremia exigua]